MNRYSFFTMLFFGIHGRFYEVINTTDMPLTIFWKSNGIASEAREGSFILASGASAEKQLETHQDNCVHIIHAASLDNRYSARSNPVCSDGRIVISKVSDRKKLVINFEKK